MTNPASLLDDTERFLGLIKEYTEKLKELISEYSQDRQRLINSFLIAFTLTVSVLSAIYAWYISGSLSRSLETDRIFLPLFVSIYAVLVAGFGGAYFNHLTKRRRRSHNAREFASIIERLINTASQYNDHSDKLGVYKFELELRLAEAEATLETYERVFRPDRIGERDIGVKVMRPSAK
jgi:hypothetical protein